MIKVTSSTQNSDLNILGNPCTSRGFGYLHGRLQTEAQKFDGWDIPDFVEEPPKAPGIYQAKVLFPDNVEVPATFFVWHPDTNPKSSYMNGLIVANDDLEMFDNAYGKFNARVYCI
jgi:hypothetical protein